MELNTEKIKRELRRLGRTQSWLAQKTNYTDANISILLKKRRPLEAAVKIGKALDIHPKDLIK